MKTQTPFTGKGTLTIKLDGSQSTMVQYWTADDEPCFDFKESKNNPHWSLWHQINNYFSRRGFSVTPDPHYQEHYKCLSKDHRYGIKNGLEYVTERFSRGFRFEFFQSINFENSHGGKYDFDKYSKMPYRIKLMYRNEMQRLAVWLLKKGVKVEIDLPLTEVQHIIINKNKCTHNNFAITSLDDWGRTMKDYDIKQNSYDRNKKPLINGELNYFYYNRRLMCGHVYFNLNTQWYAVAGGRVFHLSSGYFFDLTPDTPRREPMGASEQIQRYHTELRKAEKSMDYDRCNVLKKIILKISPKLFHVFSIKWDRWWGPNNNGYVSDKSKAGVYTEEDVMIKSPTYYNNGVSTRAVPIN